MPRISNPNNPFNNVRNYLQARDSEELAARRQEAHEASMRQTPSWVSQPQRISDTNSVSGQAASGASKELAIGGGMLGWPMDLAATANQLKHATVDPSDRSGENWLSQPSRVPVPGEGASPINFHTEKWDDFAEIPGTTDFWAKKLGIPFENTTPEIVGRLVGGLLGMGVPLVPGTKAFVAGLKEIALTPSPVGPSTMRGSVGFGDNKNALADDAIKSAEPIPDEMVNFLSDEPISAIRSDKGVLKNDPMFEGQPISNQAQNIEAGVEPGQIISTRYPKGAHLGQSERELLHSGIDPILGNPQQAESLSDIFKAQPGTRIPADASPEQALRMQVEFEAENMVDLYESLEPAVRERAKLWYQGANRRSNEMARKHGKRVENTAGVYAALSPNNDWYQNVELGDRLMDILSTKTEQPWTPEMLKVFKSRTAEGANRPMVKEFPSIKGKRLGDLTTPEQKAVWARLYDEAHNPEGLTFPMFTPEGAAMGKKLNKDGSPTQMTWQTVKNVSNAVRAFEAKGDIPSMMGIISPNMGGAHKVRNFYNNIVDPLSPGGYSTIDTHQVGAGLMRPVGGSDYQVKQNFGSSIPVSMQNALGARAASARASDKTGVYGTYGVRQEATNQAGEHLGVPGAQVQSPSWEQIRTVFPREVKGNKKLNAEIERIWNEYGSRQLSRGEAFQHIMNLRPIDMPDWAKVKAGIAAAVLGAGTQRMQEEPTNALAGS
jgi:hypothetical protein